MVTLSIEYGDTKQVINMLSQNVAAHNYRSWVYFTRYDYEAVNHLKLTVQNRYYIHNSALHLAKNGTRFERSSICNFQIFHHLAKCMSQYEDVHSFVHNVCTVGLNFKLSNWRGNKLGRAVPHVHHLEQLRTNELFGNWTWYFTYSVNIHAATAYCEPKFPKFKDHVHCTL